MSISSEAVRAQFVDFELDLSSGELTRNGSKVRLQGQPFLVLHILLERSGKVVTREELQRILWPDETFVDFDQGLNKAIAKLRDALDDSKTTSALIQTLPRRGYRFTAPVNWIGSPDGVPASPQSAAPPAEIAHRHSTPIQYWIGGGLALAVLLTAVLWINRHTVAEWIRPRPVIQSLAVLPLKNLSNDPKQQYLADGITDEIITNLSYAKSLRVVSRSSSSRFNGSDLSVPEVARQLNVDGVIEGTVLRVNNSIRITIRLVAARPERQLWAASYDRNIGDAVTLQNQIAADAVGQIRAELTPEEQNRLRLERRINPEAYDEYLRARFILHRQVAQADRAIPHLERAIQLDPNFAAAYAALGEAWAMVGVWQRNDNVQEVYAKALEYSRKGVSLDPASAEVYASLGHSLMQSRRWNESESALRRAVQLDPNNMEAVKYLTMWLILKDRLPEALALIRKAATDNPAAPDVLHVYGIALYCARQYDDAIAVSQGILDLDPEGHNSLALGLVEKGRYQEAEATFGKDRLSSNAGLQAWLYAREGKTTEAKQILKANPPLVGVFAPVARYLVGDRERAMAELDYLANEKWSIRTYRLRVDPIFDPVRNDPRFTAIVKKTGLLDN